MRITPQQAIAMLDTGTLLLDVREPEEYYTGHVRGSMNLPLSKIAQEVPTIHPDRNSPIMVCCHSGLRSTYAEQQLMRMGYSMVFDAGGVIFWPQPLAK